MKYIKRLRSIAENALRSEMLTPEGRYADPFAMIAPRGTFRVNLLTGRIAPDHPSDSVSEYYTRLAKWFVRTLEVEGIPIAFIEKAEILVLRYLKRCVVTAGGHTLVRERHYNPAVNVRR